MKQSEILDAINVNLKKFEQYNRKKLIHLHESITRQQVLDLLDIIPFLIHTNIPQLPGYIDTIGTPRGIHGYTPTKKAVSIIRELFPSAQAEANPAESFFVQMMALMGSSGTIAYTAQSDFDFWLCYDKNAFDAKSTALFQTKCTAIEKWIYDNYSTEVHFFLNDITSVKNNIFADGEEQLTGSSIGVLLKEEFFRSSIVLHGKTPFWWVVPAECDSTIYETWHRALSGAAISQRFLDIGNIQAIGPEDFLVAALFHILKSLGSPFKSIIKLGLLERYIGSTDASPFISTIIKKNIQEEKLSSSDIDAYLIMFNQIFDHYDSIIGDQATRDLLQTAFYLKVEPALSVKISEDSAEYIKEKRNIMFEFANAWGWTSQKVSQVDDFKNWGIEPVNKLLNNAKKFVLNGYKRIMTNIESHNIELKLTKEELQGITRKIYSHFLVDKNKIDNTLSFKSYPPERVLKIEYIRDNSGNEFWILSKRIIDKGKPKRVIIYKDATLFSLVIWTGLNGLYLNNFTRLDIDKGLHAMEPHFFRELLIEISSSFSIKKVRLSNNYFLRDPFPAMSFITFNPYSRDSSRIDDIFFLYHNSWGETRYEVHKSELSLGDIITRILNGSLHTGLDVEQALHIMAPSSIRSKKEFTHIRNTTRNIFHFFSDSSDGVKKRYITSLGNSYFIFYTKKSGGETSVNSLQCDSTTILFHNISLNNGLNNEIKIDPALVELKNISRILSNNKKDRIQIYFQSDKKQCSFFILDERGSLFYFQKRIDQLFEYLTRLYLFSKNAIVSVLQNNPDSLLTHSKKQLELYQLIDEGNTVATIKPVNPNYSLRITEIEKNIIPFELALSPDDSGKIQYTYSTPQGYPSNPFTRESIHEAALDIKNHITQNSNYLYYVTNLNLSSLKKGKYRECTSFFFAEKNRFELMIEKEMRHL